MTDIRINADILRRVLEGDEIARHQASKLLHTTKPTANLLGRWARHPEYWDVVIVSQKPNPDNTVHIAYLDQDNLDESIVDNVPFHELQFPEQTTDPMYVPVGEPWLVQVNGSQFRAIKHINENWFSAGVEPYWWSSSEIILVSPLVPVRPATPAAPEPEFVETNEEYAALPEGSVVAAPDEDPACKDHRGEFNTWGLIYPYTAKELAGTRRQVLRKGWGNE